MRIEGYRFPKNKISVARSLRRLGVFSSVSKSLNLAHMYKINFQYGTRSF